MYGSSRWSVTIPNIPYYKYITNNIGNFVLTNVLTNELVIYYGFTNNNW